MIEAMPDLEEYARLVERHSIVLGQLQRPEEEYARERFEAARKMFAGTLDFITGRSIVRASTAARASAEKEQG